jgi:Flp pilus assembly protein TadG
MNEQLKMLADHADAAARTAMRTANRDKTDLAEAVWKLAQTTHWIADNWPATPGTPNIQA